MAQAIFNSIVAKNGLHSSFTSISAGIDAIEGDSASKNAVAVLAADYGINMESHAARFLTKDMVINADLILTMTRSHKNMVLSYFREASGKIFTFKEYVKDETCPDLTKLGPGQDIPDPYGMNLDVYRECARQIEILSDLLLKKLE